MFLNVIKPAGLYPSMQQMDTEKMVSPLNQQTIERGHLLYVDADDEWRVAGAAQAGNATTPGAFIWFALQSGNDLTAGMAGGTPTTGGSPKIAAIACSPTLRIQTDMFDQTATFARHQLLTVGDGGIFAAHASGQTVYGQILRLPFVRWVNNAVAVRGYRTGNNVNAVEVLTMYLPCVQTV